MKYHLTIIVAFIFYGCDELGSVINQGANALLEEENKYSEIPGKNASDFLAKTYRDNSVDTSTILEILKLNELESDEETALTNSSPPEISSLAVDSLNSIQRSIANFKPDSFSLNDNSFFTKENLLLMESNETFTNDTVNWTRTEQEFMISSLDKMAVKDQGKRGTCASFAGIGQIEGFIIKKYGLEGIDLSEQRFYYMSKPEH